MGGLQIYPKRMRRNLDLTKGLIFSQRVMLALIDRGLSRQKAYELVQRNALQSWQKNKNFLTFLKADPEVTATLPPEELEPLFNEQFYLRYIDEIFRRVGLTESQWREKANTTKTNLAPRTI
jgi:adenylosuccinate lyase